MNILVTSQFGKGSERKVRPILYLLKNKKAEQALTLLSFNKNASNKKVINLIKSGQTIAKDNDLNLENLYIKNIVCDKAKNLKRHRFESKGSARIIVKHMSHIKLFLSDEIKEKVAIKDKKIQKSIGGKEK